ncbi:MAG: M20/M25/M40 family metallo-hydrolase [Victivallales bacterium]|jgi:acetylornithine deacetylase/succinyl-diaminopimelate desuccinylase-like protein
MYSIMKAKNEAAHIETDDFLKELLKVPSVSLNEQKAAELICAEMKRLDYDEAFIDDAGNAVGVIRGREAEPAIILNSHIDTVSPDSSGWKMDPFGGMVHDGMIFGAGASDCKGGIVSQLYSGALLKRSLLPMRGTLVFAATVAEENGCSIGLRKLMKGTIPSLGIKAEYAILGEPTENRLYYGHDGWAEINIHIEGVNPFHVTDAAKSINRDLSTIAGFRGGDIGIPQEMTIHSPVYSERESNGFKSADIRVSKRLRDTESAENAVQWLSHEVGTMTKNEKNIAVEVEVMSEKQMLYNGRKTVVKKVVNAWQTDPFSPLMQRSRQALAAAGCEVRTGKWKLGRLGMGTAGSVLTEEFKIQTIGFGPGKEDCAHSKDEYVMLDDVHQNAYGTAAIVHSLIGVPVCGWTSDEI